MMGIQPMGKIHSSAMMPLSQDWRVTGWVINHSNPSALPSLPPRFRPTKSLSSKDSFRRSFWKDLAKTSVPDVAQRDKKARMSISDLDKPRIDNKNRESKPTDPVTTTPANTEVKVEKVCIRRLPWGYIACGFAIGCFGYLVWQDGLYTKYRIIWIAHSPQQVEGRILDEWKGLKTNIPIEMNNEETPLPQWNWMWFLRTIPRALISMHPLTELMNRFQTLLEQSKATMTPIDVSPTIKKVLDASSSEFIIVDGQIGTGKSTAMLLLCWHEICQRRVALFLQLCNNTQSNFDYVTAIKKDPVLLRSIATFFQGQTLTIVVDDMHKYLKGERTKENAAVLLDYLWLVTEFFGVRVVFPTSDSGLKQAILDLNHSAGFEEVRMYAPAEQELTKMIQSGISETVEGNSPADIAQYCEVVGTIRELKHLRRSGNSLRSVRQITQAVFKKNVEVLPLLLNRVMLIQEGKAKGKDYVPYTRTDMKTALETLCSNHYIDPEDPTKDALCEALTEVHIARPVYDADGRYEFSSFQIEVAVRALLNLPATLTQPTEHESQEPESTGRGSWETIAVLKSKLNTFQAKKKATDLALGKDKC